MIYIKNTHQLSTLTEGDIYTTALHPRLEKPMRVIDSFLFVAHDAHYLGKITEIKRAQE